MNEIELVTHPDEKRLKDFEKIAKFIGGVTFRYQPWNETCKEVTLCFENAQAVSGFYYQLGILDMKRQLRETMGF